LLPAISELRQIIAVPMQATGRAADIDRALCFELMAEDIAALMKRIGIDRADLVGYSLGGGRRVAHRHPAPPCGAQTRAHLHNLQTGWIVSGGPGRHGPDGSTGCGRHETFTSVPALSKRRLAGVIHKAR